jgi:NAD(P)-dependent dehydrogenase (short-subunit alcohol dehydrogenase family)
VIFDGTRVLITGAAKGIGQATALHFAQAGARVALLDRDAAALEHTCRAIGPTTVALPLVADVSSSADTARAVAQAIDRFGGLDVLVINAGISFARAIDEYRDEEWTQILNVNLNGAFFAIRAAVAALRASRGSIVLVSSMTALVGQDHGAAYAASKGALVSMTKALALELGADAVRVNCVCPAGVDTPLMRSWAGTLPDPEAVLRAQAEMHLLKRMATPAEIAAAIAFLASPDASFITGAILPVEGGATLGYRSGR